MASKTRNEARLHRHRRVRKKISGTSERPRLCVFRSHAEIYAQLIDDLKGVTLASASSLDTEIRDIKDKKTKTEKAAEVGKLLADRAKNVKVKRVVFDRGGYQFMGRVKALAESARKEGLEF
jgi:large subunit ribosomal protein L18